jgi:hypothetical protein
MPRPKKDTTATYNFPGFVTPKSNYFRLPNDWPSITAKIDNLAELKCVEYVLRHTWGYSEYGVLKHISNDEFVGGRKRKDGSRIDEGTGMSLRAVRDGLNKAVEHGFLNEYVDDSDRGRIRKYYSLKMQEVLEEEAPGADGGDTLSEAEILERQTLPGGRQTLPTRGANKPPRTEKDTLDRNFEENTLYPTDIERHPLDIKPGFSFSKKSFDDFENDNSNGKNDRQSEPTKVSTILNGRYPRNHPESPETGSNAAAIPEDDSQPGEVVKRGRGRPRKYPPISEAPAWLQLRARDLSNQLNDPDHAEQNLGQLWHLFIDSGAEEGRFNSKVDEAKGLTLKAVIEKKAAGEAGKWGLRNRAPYFFSTLRDKLGLPAKGRKPNNESERATAVSN